MGNSIQTKIDARFFYSRTETSQNKFLKVKKKKKGKKEEKDGIASCLYLRD
jgi:hypothetical protein